jgi:hypothetical protein
MDNITTPFHNVPFQVVALLGIKCCVGICARANFVCMSAPTLYTCAMHTRMGINPSVEQYKVVQVHRVNGSSELIHAGWQAALRVSRYAQQKQYRARQGYKVTAKRDTHEIRFAESVYNVNMKIALTDATLVPRLRGKKNQRTERCFCNLNSRRINCILPSRDLYMLLRIPLCRYFILLMIN